MGQGLMRLPALDEVGTVTHLKDALAQRGVALSDGEARQLAAVRSSALKETERFEFGLEGFAGFVERALCLPVSLKGEGGNEIADAVELFYEVRSEVSVEVSDDEVSEAICNALMANEGVVADIDVSDLREVLESPEDSQGSSYSIADDEGRVYHWSPSDWAYDEYTPGWNGEAWESDDE